jgi:hypothetical protein
MIYLIISLTILILFELYTGFNFHKFFNKNLYKCTDLKINTNQCSNNCKLAIKYRISDGELKASKSKLVICGLSRNIEQLFDILKKRLEKTGSLFAEYKIVIFENNSNDNSRFLLKKWSQENNNVILLDCCSLGDCECDLKKMVLDKDKIGMFNLIRMKKMAMYRNKYLDYVKKNLSFYDYMMVYDTDMEGCYSNDGLMHSISFNNWDMIASSIRAPLLGTFGLSTVIYDSLAYVDLKEKNIKDDAKFYKQPFKWVKMNNGVNKQKKNCDLFPVKSAFNGLAIYKVKSVLNSSYKIATCEHIGLHVDMIKNGKDKLYINPFFTGYSGYQGQIGSGLRSITSIFS